MPVPLDARSKARMSLTSRTRE